jgi:hypothetical protein
VLRWCNRGEQQRTNRGRGPLNLVHIPTAASTTQLMTYLSAHNGNAARGLIEQAGHRCRRCYGHTPVFVATPGETVNTRWTLPLWTNGVLYMCVVFGKLRAVRTLTQQRAEGRRAGIPADIPDRRQRCEYDLRADVLSCICISCFTFPYRILLKQGCAVSHIWDDRGLSRDGQARPHSAHFGRINSGSASPSTSMRSPFLYRGPAVARIGLGRAEPP